LTGVLLTSLTAVSAWRLIDCKKWLYYLINLLYIFSFTLVIVANNWFIFITAWEMVTLTTTLLLLWSNRRIALQYFVVQFVGSSFLLYAILMAIGESYLKIGPINEPWLQNLFVIGLGMKSAVFGLHFWLPPIHSRAPSPVSAILSGWVVKLGFITYLKIIVDGNQFLLYLGLLMIFYGGIKALLATDYKVLLAFSSISQLGYIALGIGSGTYYGYLGSIFHIIAHGLAKSLLFIGSGYWLKEYGAWQRQRLNSIGTIIGFMSLMGLPFIFGYYGKHLIKHGIENSLFLNIILHVGSILTILYALRFLRWGIMGDKKKVEDQREIHRTFFLDYPVRISLLIPSVILLLLGIWPGILKVWLPDMRIENNWFMGIISYSGYLLLSFLLLSRLNWLKVKEKEPPSLDRLFKRVYQYLRLISIKCRRFDAEAFFEHFLYPVLFRLSRRLYLLIYRNFQVQLFWIPLFLIMLLLWISYR